MNRCENTRPRDFDRKDIFKEAGITRRDFVDFKLKVHENIISKLQERDQNKLYSDDNDPTNESQRKKNPFQKRALIWNHIEEQNPYLFLGENNNEDNNNNDTNFININDFSEMDGTMLDLMNKEEVQFEELHRTLKENNRCFLYDINDVDDGKKEICYTFQTPSVQTYFLYIPIKIVKTNEKDIRNPIVQLLAYFYLVK